MLVFVMRRFATMILTMIVVSILLFLLMEVNVEGVAVKVLGPYSSEEQRNIWLERNGYFDPMYERYLGWLGRFVLGDFGESVRFKVPVGDVMWPRLGSTAILAVAMADEKGTETIVVTDPKDFVTHWNPHSQ